MSEEKEIDKGDAFYYLGTQDGHIIRLFEWIYRIERLAEEVRSSNQDDELYNLLRGLEKRLKTEVGVRICAIFP